MTLSDTQLLILSAASQRTDHAAVLPANLKGSAAKKVVDKLLNEKLLQELRAKDDMPVWRRGGDNSLTRYGSPKPALERSRSRMSPARRTIVPRPIPMRSQLSPLKPS